MSGTSNVGNRGVYEAGDQRTSKDSEEQHAERYHEGKENSHKANDSSTVIPDMLKIQNSKWPICSHLSLEDERSIANRLGREEKREHEEEEESLQKKQIEKDPTLPVSSLCRHVSQAHPDLSLHPRPSLTAMSQARVPKSMPKSSRRKRRCSRRRTRRNEVCARGYEVARWQQCS
jgi:hypothetical protein